MNDPASLTTFFAAAHRCAMEMADNVLYIRQELPRVDLPPGLADTLNDACDELISAKFDIISDLSGLDDLLGRNPDSPAILSKARDILDRLDTTFLLLHPVVMNLEEAAVDDPCYHLAFLLVAESAVNVLNAHGSVPRFGDGQSSH